MYEHIKCLLLLYAVLAVSQNDAAQYLSVLLFSKITASENMTEFLHTHKVPRYETDFMHAMTNAMANNS